MASSVYIHIPFCKSICSYCDFCKFLYNEKWVYVYLEALKNEIKDRYMGEKLKTVYVGGGTPSCLTLKEIKKLMDIINIMDISEVEEFTFECNISDISLELLSLLKEYKVNRLSIGIESFDDANLTFMEREGNFQDTKEKIKLCRSLGFNNINLDLMYALPGESLKVLKKDLELILKLKPEHISTYSLMIENHTKAYVNNTSYIDEELDYEMYNYICKTLNGANHYEVSNFAVPGFESKHNLVYWHNEEYYGFGLGASGYIDKVRYTNTKSLKKYLLGDVVEEREFVSIEDDMKYEVMLGLRLSKGINIMEFKRKFDKDIETVFNLKPLFKNKELIKKRGYIYINPVYVYVMNEILLKII